MEYLIGKRAIAFGGKINGIIKDVMPHETSKEERHWYVILDNGHCQHKQYFLIEGEDGISGKLFKEHEKEFTWNQ